MKKLTLTLLFALVGCASQTWNKPGATQNEFNADRYACLQESQQQQGRAYVNPYGGAAQSGSVTNIFLFRACMQAHGWNLQ